MRCKRPHLFLNFRLKDMTCESIALSLTYVILLRLAKFPEPFIPGSAQLVLQLWQCSLLYLDEHQGLFARAREPDVAFVLRCCLQSREPSDWTSVGHLWQPLHRLWLKHFHPRTLQVSLLAALLTLSRRLVQRLLPEPSPASVDLSLQLVAMQPKKKSKESTQVLSPNRHPVPAVTMQTLMNASKNSQTMTASLERAQTGTKVLQTGSLSHRYQKQV